MGKQSICMESNSHNIYIVIPFGGEVGKSMEKKIISSGVGRSMKGNIRKEVSSSSASEELLRREETKEQSASRRQTERVGILIQS